MNPKTTLFMGGAFVVVLVTLAVLKLVHAPTDAERAASRDKVIPDLHNVEADNLTQVSLTREKEQFEFTYVDSGDRWQMSKPIDVLAQTSAVRDLFFDLKNLTRRAGGAAKDEKVGVFEPKSSADLAQYGLDSPSSAVTVTFKPKGSDKETKTVTLQVGAPTADKDGLYVKVADEKFVFVVNKSNLKSLEKKPSEFRQQKLVTISRFDSDMLRLQWPDRHLQTEKKDTKWQLVEPIADRADNSKVEELIGKLADLKADTDADYVDDAATDLAKYGLDNPQLVAEIRKPGTEAKSDDEKKKAKSKEKEKPIIIEKVLIGGPVEGRDDRVYAKLADQKNVVAVAASIVNDLSKQPNDIRSRDLVELTMSDVDYVRIQRGEAGEIAVGKKDKWEIYQPKSTEADSPTVDEFVKKIDGLEIKEFIDQADLKEHGLDQPSATVAIYQKGLKTDDKDKDAKDKSKKDGKDKDKKDEKKEEASDAATEPKGEPIRVAFGKRDDENKLVYVRRGDEPGIFAVSSEGLPELLDRDYLAYRRKQVVTFSDFDVAKLSIYRDGKTFSLERKKESDTATAEKWRLTEPVDAPADSFTVSDFLRDFARLNAKQFFAEGAADLKAYGLDEPKIRATATLKADEGKDGDQHVLLVGSEAEGGGHFAKLGSSDLIFSIEQRIVNDLNAELHDRTLIKFDSPKVDGLKLTWPDAKLELANKKPEGKSVKEWSVVGDESFKLDTTKTGSLVTYLSLLNTDKFVQYQGDFTEEQGLTNPALVIEVRVEGESTPKTLRIGAAAEGEKRYVATTEKAGPVALLPDERIKELLTGPKYFAVADEKKPDPEKSETPKSEEDKKDDAKPDAEKKDDADKKNEKKSDEKKDDTGTEKESAKPEAKKPESKSDSAPTEPKKGP
jgi:hypothetical protein